MYPKYTINHLIPGRIRLTIPGLANTNKHPHIEEMLESIKGIQHVRLVPIIQSIVIEYDVNVLNYKQIIQYITILFQQDQTNYSKPVKVDYKSNLLRSGIAGILLLAALFRKKTATSMEQPDTFDYFAAIATTCTTVLSHGEHDRLNHPDVIGGIISMISLGPDHILQVALVTWFVNLVEVFNDLRKNSHSQFLYQ